MSRSDATVGGGSELVRRQRSWPVVGSGPVREPVTEVALQPQVVQVLERAAEHRAPFDAVGHPVSSPVRMDIINAATSINFAVLGVLLQPSPPVIPRPAVTAGCLYSA